MLHDQYRGAALCAGDEGATSFQRQAYDYARHGVTTLFAALEVATGQVTDACYPRHRHQMAPGLAPKCLSARSLRDSFYLVGVAGFEPAASSSRTER